MVAVVGPKTRINRANVYHLTCKFKADENDDLEPEKTMRVSFSANHFIHTLAATGTTTKSYGWYTNFFVADAESKVQELEVVLTTLLPQAQSAQKTSSQLFPQDKYEGDLFGIFLGKLTASKTVSTAMTTTKTQFYVFLYFNLLGNGTADWQVGLVAKSPRNNNALEKRIKDGSSKTPNWSCLQNKVNIKIGNGWNGFEPANYDLTKDGSHHQSMMIFHPTSATNYNDMLIKWRNYFELLKPLPRSEFEAKQLRVAIGLPQKNVEALHTTTSDMGIHSCGKKFKVTTDGSSQRVVQIDPVLFHDKTTSAVGADCFPIDTEQKLLALDAADKRKLFSCEIPLHQLHYEIFLIEEYIRTTFNHRSKEEQFLILGGVAHSLYSSLKWRVAQPQPFQAPVINIGLSYDIDQISLDIREIGTFLGRQFYAHDCPFQRNFDFLQFHYHNMLIKVSVAIARLMNCTDQNYTLGVWRIYTVRT
jgi:hypothetical protein